MKKKKTIKCPECGKEFKNLKLHHKAHQSEMGKGYKFIDLFAGIGGFHLAFHDLGLRCVFASEWDGYARKTYEKNFKKISPELFRSNNFVGDIRDIENKNIPDFDILAAGFPCQPFSQAGLNNGFEDTRGTMFNEIAKLIKVKKPKAFLLENVRHLKNMNEGRAFKTIKKIIKKDLGYSFYSKVIKAHEFGLPQLRPRLFMVGFRDSRLKFDFPEPYGLNKTMSDVWNGDCDRDLGYTLRVGGRRSGIDDRRNWDAYRVDGEVVFISTEEAKEMMGFPPDFSFPVSETQAMKQLGNSVAVPVVKAIGRKVVKVLNKRYD